MGICFRLGLPSHLHPVGKPTPRVSSAASWLSCSPGLTFLGQLSLVLPSPALLWLFQAPLLPWLS